MGIAHTRPGGTSGENAAHPSFNMDKTMRLYFSLADENKITLHK